MADTNMRQPLPDLDALAKHLFFSKGAVENGLFRWLADEIKDGIVVVDKDIRLVYVNKAVADAFGIPAEELIGRPLQDFISDANRQAMLKGFERRKRGEHDVFRQRWDLINGRVIDTIVSSRPVYDADGGFAGSLSIVSNMSERKAMEQAVRESQSRYLGVFEDSPISLWIEDLSDVKAYFNELKAKGVEDFSAYFEQHDEAVQRCVEKVKILDINRSTLHLLAANTKDQLLASLGTVVPPSEYPKIRDEFAKLAQGELFYRGEIDHITLEGQRKNLMVQFNVVPGYEETLERVVVSLLDITEHKRAQEETKKSKALLEKTFAGLREAVFIVDAESDTIIDVNPAASKIFGYPKKWMLGRKPSFMFAGEEVDPEHIRYFSGDITEEEPLSLPVTTMVRSDGEMILTESDVSPLRDESGKQIAWVCVIRDVTEEAKVREQLERAQKLEALGALAGGIAHEINQPLNALRLYSSSLEMLLESGREVKEETIMSRLKYISTETDKIKDIITHLRNLVRQEGGDTTREADLNESVRRAVSLLGTQIKSHGIRLSMSLAKGLPNVRANPIQLEQVVINLSINAMQALDEVGRENKIIGITTAMENGCAKLTVRDNGPGLGGSEEDIFKPFYTTKNRSSAQGMGLGLSIVDTFIRAWGGQIKAIQRPEGGAEFNILLTAL